MKNQVKFLTKYNWYVTAKNAAGSLRICSGWDYKEDAREGAEDVKECGIYKDVKIYSCEFLEHIKVNIHNENLWVDYTAKDNTDKLVEITPEGMVGTCENIQDAINNLFDKIKKIKCIDDKLDVAFSAGALINTIHYNYKLYKKGGE